MTVLTDTLTAETTLATRLRLFRSVQKWAFFIPSCINGDSERIIRAKPELSYNLQKTV